MLAFVLSRVFISYYDGVVFVANASCGSPFLLTHLAYVTYCIPGMIHLPVFIYLVSSGKCLDSFGRCCCCCRCWLLLARRGSCIQPVRSDTERTLQRKTKIREKVYSTSTMYQNMTSIILKVRKRIMVVLLRKQHPFLGATGTLKRSSIFFSAKVNKK